MIFLFSILSLCTLIHSRTFKDTKTILTQIEKSQFGQGMLSLLQSNQAVGNEVTDILETLVDQLNTDQQNADKKNATDQNACTQNIVAYTQSISNLKIQISNLETLIEEKEGILKLAQTVLGQAKSDYAEVIEEIKAGTEQRLQEHNSWKERDDQFNVDIVTLEEGVRLIQHMLHGVSFSEISNRYNKVLSQLGSSKQNTLYNPLISQLTQLASKINFDNVQKVLELLNEMRKNLVEERATDRENEETQQRDWGVLLGQLNKQKKQLEGKISKNTKIIEVTTEELKNSRVSLATAQASLENNQSLLAKQEEWCLNESLEYTQETEERERELEIINDLLEHLEKSSQQVNRYLEERTENAPTA